MKCDLRCPPIKMGPGPKYCCSNCPLATDTGCPLPREEMPIRCKRYDCKEYRFFVDIGWDGQKWVVSSLASILANNCDREFIDKYNELMFGKDYENTDSHSVSRQG